MIYFSPAKCGVFITHQLYISDATISSSFRLSKLSTWCCAFANIGRPCGEQSAISEAASEASALTSSMQCLMRAQSACYLPPSHTQVGETPAISWQVCEFPPLAGYDLSKTPRNYKPNLRLVDLLSQLKIFDLIQNEGRQMMEHVDRQCPCPR